jgi:acyl dehydratase
MLKDVKVGTELPPLRVPAISRKTLALFAGASGDHQPTHIDIDAARAKGRDDVIAHGMLVMAYMSRILTDFVPQDRIRSFATRFLAVTPVHGELTCTGRVVAVKDGMAHLELETRLADGKIVARGEAVIDLRL